MPNEESRIKRDDPLTAILAQTDASEVKWSMYVCAHVLFLFRILPPLCLLKFIQIPRVQFNRGNGPMSNIDFLTSPADLPERRKVWGRVVKTVNLTEVASLFQQS